MIKTAWKKNLKKIWLSVFSDNIPAQKIYRNLGFELEGIFLDDEISLNTMTVSGKYSFCNLAKIKYTKLSINISSGHNKDFREMTTNINTNQLNNIKILLDKYNL